MKRPFPARRTLWLLALPLLSFSSLAHAQDAAPEAAGDETEQPAELPDGGDIVGGTTAGGIDGGTPLGAVAEPEQRPIDTLDFAAYMQSLGGAATLELNQTQATPVQIAAAIAQATGLRVEASPQWEAYPDSRITAKVERAPLWDALAQLKARGIDAQWIAPTRTLQLMPLSDVSEAKVPPRNPLSLQLGAAQLGVTRVQRTRALLFPAAIEGGQKQDRFEIEMSMRPDPRWRTIDGTASWAGLSLVDAKGKAHPVLSEAAGGTLEGAQAAFDASSVDASGPATLRGEIRFAVVAKSQKWTLNDLSKPAQLDIQRDGVPVRYEFLGTSESNGGLSLKFAASNAANAPGTVVALPSPDPNVPASNLPLYHFAGVGSGGGLRLLQGNGAPVEFLEAGSGLQSIERSEFEVQTIPDPSSTQATPPAKVEVEVPLEWREVRVPFEIKNIPLP